LPRRHRSSSPKTRPIPRPRTVAVEGHVKESVDLRTLAGWPAAETPWLLPHDARRRLIDATAGLDAESRFAELEFLVTIAREAPTLPAKRRRAELADVVHPVEQTAAALANMHIESRHELLLALYRAGLTATWLRQVEHDVGVLSSVARDARDSIPGRGGRPPLTLRMGVIRATCAWVESLPPSRARASLRDALSRNAEKDHAHVQLVAPKDDLTERCVESVKIVLKAAGIDLPSDVRAIVLKVLTKKPV